MRLDCPSRHVAATELTPQQQTCLVAALRRHLERDCGRPVEMFETHISFVLVTPASAYKIKKALVLDFLDFGTRDKRRDACSEELRLNRRLAPALYLDVARITGSPDAPTIDGDGPAIEHAVRMRSFAQDGLWDRLARRGELGAAHVDALAAQVQAFHAAAPPAAPDSRFGRPQQLRAAVRDNIAALLALAEGTPEADALMALDRWERARFESLGPVFEQRRLAGRVRECHGDLHLGNVAQIEGRTTVFDCIEFNDDFRWIDVMSDVAFMAMDLRAHGLDALAHRFVDGWLQHGGDYAGVQVLRYYVVHRALVRAKVAALRARQTGAPPRTAVHVPATLIDLALATTRPPPPALLITRGFSGSGKTTLTQSLLEAIGAVRIRADVERKRLFGLDALARSGSALHAGLYGAAATEATYRRLREQAEPVLRGGCSAILDATFLQRAQRDAARATAAALAVPFVILDFDVAPDRLRERVRRRAESQRDASEADESVLDAQLRHAQPLQDEELDAVHRVTAASVPGDPSYAHAAADWSALAARLGHAGKV